MLPSICWTYLAMHEQPDGKGDIETSLDHTGVHRCSLDVGQALRVFTTEMVLGA